MDGLYLKITRIACCLALAFLPAMAQTTTGSIVGSVTDTTGAVVPGAALTVTNIDTGGSNKTITDSSGNYVVTPLPVGHYTVTVEAKLYDAKGVLCLDARNRLRFSMAGMGSLIDNRGTSKASRVVEMYNGRAEISLTRKDGGSVVGVSTAGIKPAFCNIA